jgi:hypothetical protein
MASTVKAPPREPVKCARPACRNTFIPYRHTHKYCSPRCKMSVYDYRFALRGGK